MTRERAPSKSTLLVLSQLYSGSEYGYALMKSTGLKSGTLYPILMRLTDRGYLSSKWEEPKDAGRPPRQTYKLTPKGQAYAQRVLTSEQATPIQGGITT